MKSVTMTQTEAKQNLTNKVNWHAHKGESFEIRQTNKSLGTARRHITQQIVSRAYGTTVTEPAFFKCHCH
jgi:hypothetical protein